MSPKPLDGEANLAVPKGKQGVRPDRDGEKSGRGRSMSAPCWKIATSSRKRETKEGWPLIGRAS